MLNVLPEDFQVRSYVDIGCGTCQITDQISQILRVERTVAADIVPFTKIRGILRGCQSKIHYVQIDQKQPRVNVKSQTVDLVTCYMSIHHFQDQAAMLSEIKRVIKPGGYLFIREHDADMSNTELIDYLNKIHQEFKDHSFGEAINFLSRSALKSTLEEKFNFKHISDSDYSDHNFNRQAVYHSLFQAPTDIETENWRKTLFSSSRMAEEL